MPGLSWTKEEDDILKQLIKADRAWPHTRAFSVAACKILKSRTAFSIGKRLKDLELEVNLIQPEIDRKALEEFLTLREPI